MTIEVTFSRYPSILRDSNHDHLHCHFLSSPVSQFSPTPALEIPPTKIQNPPPSAFSLRIQKTPLNLSLEMETNSATFLSKVIPELSFAMSPGTFKYLLQLLSLFYSLIDRNEIVKNILKLWTFYFENIYSVTEEHLLLSQGILRTVFATMSYQKISQSLDISRLFFAFKLKNEAELGTQKVAEVLMEAFKVNLYDKLSEGNLRIFVECLLHSENARQVNLVLKSLIGFLIYNESEGVFLDMELKTKATRAKPASNVISLV